MRATCDPSSIFLAVINMVGADKLFVGEDGKIENDLTSEEFRTIIEMTRCVKFISYKDFSES